MSRPPSDGDGGGDMYRGIFAGTVDDFQLQETNESSHNKSRKRKNQQEDTGTWFGRNEVPEWYNTNGEQVRPEVEDDDDEEGEDNYESHDQRPKAIRAALDLISKSGPDSTTQYGWFTHETGVAAPAGLAPLPVGDEEEESDEVAIGSEKHRPAHTTPSSWAAYGELWTNLVGGRGGPGGPAAPLAPHSAALRERDDQNRAQMDALWADEEGVADATPSVTPIVRAGAAIAAPAQWSAGFAESLQFVQRWVDWGEKARKTYYNDVFNRTYMARKREDPRLSQECKGAQWFNEGIRNLDKLPLKLVPDQLAFVRSVYNLCLPHIYKEDYARFKHTLLAQMKESGFQKMLALACPRQYGKSTTVAAAASGLLSIGRGINIVIVATGQDIASKLMQQTMSNYAAMVGAEKIIFQNRKMSMVVRADVPANTPRRDIIRNGWFNTVRACSSNARTQRGINANVIILDESNFTHSVWSDFTFL